MYSIGIATTLRPGAYPKYKEYHDNLWPDIAKGMADNNVSMAIFRLGNRLIVHAVAPTEVDWTRSREDPKLDEWHEVMKEMLETDANGGLAFELLEPAFEFGMFKQDG